MKMIMDLQDHSERGKEMVSCTDVILVYVKNLKRNLRLVFGGLASFVKDDIFNYHTHKSNHLAEKRGLDNFDKLGLTRK